MEVYKTIMGTIPRSSSHSPFPAEAVNGAGLLLFRPAALQVLRSGFATHGFPVLRVTADPSGCPFATPKHGFRDEVSFRLRCHFPEDQTAVSGFPGAEALRFPEAL